MPKDDFPTVVQNFAPVLKTMQRATGVSSLDLIRAVGAEIGKEIARNFVSRDFDSLIDEMAELWRCLGLGVVGVKSKQPLIISVTNSLGCSSIEDATKCSSCALRGSMLKTVLDERLEVDSLVELMKSEGEEHGPRRCDFKVVLRSVVPLRSRL